MGLQEPQHPFSRPPSGNRPILDDSPFFAKTEASPQVPANVVALPNSPSEVSTFYDGNPAVGSNVGAELPPPVRIGLPAETSEPQLEASPPPPFDTTFPEPSPELPRSTEPSLASLEQVDDLRDALRHTPMTSADILAGAIPPLTSAVHDDPELHLLVGALQEPIERAIELSANSPGSRLSQALNPLMGRLVTRYLSEFSQEVKQMIDERIEIATSPKRLLWAVQAKLRGMTYSEFLDEKIGAVRVREVCLFARPDFDLLAQSSTDRDLDALALDSSSAYGHCKSIQHRLQNLQNIDDSLPAILRFEEDGMHLLIISNHATVFGAVVGGVLSGDLIEKLKSVADSADDHLRQSGQTVEGGAIRALISAGLINESKAELPPNRVGLRLGYAALGLLTLMGLAIYGLSTYRWSAFSDQLTEAPGIEVIEIEQRFGRTLVRGLRDPRAEDPAAIATAIGLDPNQIDFRFGAYRSLDQALD